jgi:hypothetical protein
MLSVSSNTTKQGREMKTWLETLEDRAERLLNMMDNELQAPIIHTLTGEVFTHGTPSRDDGEKAKPVQAVTQPAPETKRKRQSESASAEGSCPPLLRQADAS